MHPPAEGTAAVVLAAGEARRFGGPKLLMPFGDSTVIGCVTSALAGAGVEPIIVAVGANRAEIEGALVCASVQLVENPDPSRGMLSSIQVGVAALPRSASRFLIALADQPRVTAEEIRQLIADMTRAGRGIARPIHRGKRGHPVLLASRYRDEILALPPEATLRDVIHRHLDDVVEVDVASDAVVRDIDTREEYEDERQRAQPGSQP
ncbi:MAG: NTP transferase domain-containing protein [Armatimonadota bacterium]